MGEIKESLDFLKVKIFSGRDYNKIEDDVNLFLKNNKIQNADISISTQVVDHGMSMGYVILVKY